MRRSLLVRFLVIAIVIVTASIAGTAWIVTSAVSRRDALRIDGNARTDQRIVTAVQQWAGGERSWDGVTPLLIRLSEEDHRRIALMDENGRVLADTDRDLPPPQSPGVPVDPLTQTYADTLSPISTTVSGAFALTPAERAQSRARAEAALACSAGRPQDLRTWPNGRVVLPNVPGECQGRNDGAPFPSEQLALDTLTRMTNTCLQAKSLETLSSIELDTTSAGAAAGISLRLVGDDHPVAVQAAQLTRTCVTDAWLALNENLVPPRAYLITTDLQGDRPSLASLTTDSLARIAAVVLGLIVLSSMLVLVFSWRAVRRIRTLQAVTDRLRRGHQATRAVEDGHDEIAQLGSAINQLADQLQHVQRQRDQFTADIAHDLRTPLTNIRGWIEAWRDGVARHESEVLDIVDSEAEHLQRLVTDLQTVALTDARELSMNPELFDLASMLRTVVAARRTDHPRFVYEGPGSFWVTGDRGQLRQVVDNLLTNADVHAEASAVIVRLTPERDRVRVDVADDGAGLPPEMAARMFDRLWRADPVRSRTTGGHGLGLTISRRLVELHGGQLTVSAASPHGAVFTMRLPINARN
ncbi:HAMP domain-containing histidine kinase [Kineococcus sp. NBC_00420]|uniref:sensor histidine kinase n=1 Tax=Kineococcus sp. NBC_00420 TaxID=2903564 RepID=UPI002E2144A9